MHKIMACAHESIKPQGTVVEFLRNVNNANNFETLSALLEYMREISAM